jgi:hypothetical protein
MIGGKTVDVRVSAILEIQALRRPAFCIMAERRKSCPVIGWEMLFLMSISGFDGSI